MIEAASARTVPGQIVHPDLATLRRALGAHAVWFHATALGSIDAAPALAGRLTLQRCGDAACMTVDALAPDDLPALSRLFRSVLVVQAHAIPHGFGGRHLVRALDDAGLRLFVPHGTSNLPQVRTHGVMGTLEFLLSDAGRLDRHPVFGQRLLRSDPPPPETGPVAAIFVLDLIQDYEILRPILVLAAQPFGPLRARVAVTERILASYAWGEIRAFLSAMGLPWFKPLGPMDVANALGSARSLLVTASESSASGHAFSHEACRCAPARARRVTFQHGYECIGLRHHRAHDMQFPQGVRFASDLIFTWRSSDELPDLHPGDRDKCVPVGITKAIAQRAATMMEDRWNGVPDPEFDPLPSANALILAENLHSVRFGSPRRYERFLRFIQDAHAQEGAGLVVRSHPGKRTLEKMKSRMPFRFLEGTLTADHFGSCRGLISPPSTIVLDAACCARDVALWTDAARLGDVANYQGLPTMTHAAQIRDDWLTGNAEQRGIDALKWAVDNTTSLNGIPAAWQHLREAAR